MSSGQAVVAGRDLKRVTLTSLGWASGGRVLQQLLRVLALTALARMLIPADFGLVAMVAVFTGFAAVLVDLGFTAALVARREVTEQHLASAFWLNAAMGVLLALAMSALAPVVAAIYDQPRLVAIMPLLSLAFPLSALSAVQVALAQRTMDFRRLALVEGGATLISLAAAVTAAAGGLGVWSLVVQALTEAGCGTLGLWLTSAWRPTRRFDRAAVRELMSFGGNLVGFNVMNYWIRNADNFLVGRFAGAGALGFYSRAYALMLLPLSQVTWVTGRVMFPALARMAHETERVKRVYLDATSLIAFVTFPLMAILVVAAEPFILTVLGPKWDEAIPLFRLLGLAGLLQSVSATAGWLYQSQGRTDLMFRWGLVNGAVTVGAFAVGIHWGAIGVATAYLLRTILFVPLSFVIPGRLIGMRLREVLHVLWATTLVCALVAAVLVPIELSGLPTGIRLLVEVAVGTSLYVGLSAMLGLRAYREARSLFLTHVLRRGPVVTA
jgi:O-antigen/teichoic acid export membrane protein